MSSNDIKAYLAEKYMSGPKADAILSRVAPAKKRKRKAAIPEPHSGATSMVRDDDGGWGDEGKNEIEEDHTEAIVAADRAFKKRRKQQEEGSGWATIQEGIKQESPPPADEQPLVVESAPIRSGLMTAKQLQAAAAKPQETTWTKEEIAAAQETVYRDATGKKIDTKAARAEAARLKREREEKEAQKMEWGKGLVQREDAEKRKLEMEKNKNRKFARHADDADLNEELKAKELWNDPAAAFLTKKTAKGPRKPQYAGPPPPPNRFGIKPGYRWDGVDRGNGFEKKLFQSKNERKRKGLESYQWSAEDM